MPNDAAQTTLRDELSAAFDEVVQTDEKPVAEAPAEVPAEAGAAPEKPETPGRTAGRPRDEKGRLLPGKPEKNAAADAPKADTAPTEEPGTPAPAAAPDTKPRPQRPSTWKKEYWQHWDKLDPALAEYIHQREGEYAKGVSTYKTEYDRLKPVADTLAPYAPMFQQAGVKPEQAISHLMQNHQTLAYGNPQQKLQMFARLATDYGIPLHELLVQGEDGKVYLNQQYFQQQSQQQAQGITPAEIERIVSERLAVAQLHNAVQQFQAAKDASGNPLYPHFDTVRQTMDGILRAGLAQDLPSAYNAALRMPQHADIFEAQQEQQRHAKAEAEAKAKQQQAQRARAAAVSTRSSAPTGNVTGADKGSKGLRDSIAEAFEQHESGRV